MISLLMKAWACRSANDLRWRLGRRRRTDKVWHCCFLSLEVEDEGEDEDEGEVFPLRIS